MNRYEIILKKRNFSLIIDVVEGFKKATDFVKSLLDQKFIDDDWDIEIRRSL